DPRAQPLPLVQRPFTILGLMAGYTLFVTRLGPWLMRDRRPYELKRTLIVYNALQILTNLYIFQGFCQFWFTTYNWQCEPIDWSDSASALEFNVSADAAAGESLLLVEDCGFIGHRIFRSSEEKKSNNFPTLVSPQYDGTSQLDCNQIFSRRPRNLFGSHQHACACYNVRLLPHFGSISPHYLVEEACDTGATVPALHRGAARGAAASVPAVRLSSVPARDAGPAGGAHHRALLALLPTRLRQRARAGGGEPQGEGGVGLGPAASESHPVPVKDVKAE
ncbi:Elongation of very long chain fatty acids protein, partial [Gryllus bimaculatus]